MDLDLSRGSCKEQLGNLSLTPNQQSNTPIRWKLNVGNFREVGAEQALAFPNGSAGIWFDPKPPFSLISSYQLVAMIMRAPTPAVTIPGFIYSLSVYQIWLLLVP